jgi:hypothetical protein
LNKRKRLIISVIVIVLAVSLSLVGLELLVYSHMYPQESFNGKANLAVKGVVTSIKDNYKVEGMVMGSYHIFQSLIRLNVTEILWVDNYLADTKIPFDSGTLGVTYGFNSSSVYDMRFVSIGYDNLDNPNLSVGQTIECRGDYDPRTDSPYSFKINVSPSINGSYLIIA